VLRFLGALAAEGREQAGQQQRPGHADEAAGDDRRGVAEGGRDRARFHVAEERAAGDDGDLQPSQAASEGIRDRERHDRGAEDGRDHVGPARHGQ
jgi:hypothetical protein